MVLLSLVYLLHSEDSKGGDAVDNEITSSVNTIVEKYGDRAYRAFYSIEELRPYCIIQIDKIIEMFDDDWLSPSTIVPMLDKNDKELLKIKVLEYIKSLDNDNKKNVIVLKIISWCKADMQFSFLKEELGIYPENLMQALHNVNIKKQLIAKYYDYKSANTKEMSDEQKDYVYFKTLNILSIMNFKDQMLYYGDVYNQLALLCAN